LKALYTEQKKAFHQDPEFVSFFNANIHWLVPYAAFSYLRDLNGTPDFTQWKKHNVYREDEIAKLCEPGKKHYDEIAVFYFVQFHLHKQLKDATAYAHEQGLIIKGDIPIGIYRNSCDAWMEPDLYNMDMQAGAPPDDFAVKGQNWGFPTYNWQRMAQDGFGWWKRRFEQMSHYFDAFRIDHILGFFRIWSIPMHAVEGILGYFVPAIPVHVSEFGQKGIWFDYQRFCKPYLTDQVFRDILGIDAEWLYGFVQPTGGGQYELKEEFNTQRKVEAHFAAQEDNEMNRRMMHALYDCISNVILIEPEGGSGQDFHFRISMSSTLSFRYLDVDTKWRLEELYVNYFFRRQDEFWKKEAMEKLPALKRSTNMLICGEDLGMVPGCVPDVMKQLGMLSLEIQRMPKDPKRTFFHPADAPYLSVVTPSTHDMSTIRGWWEEDRAKTQDFYNHQMGHFGGAPFYCEPWIVKEILVQHFHSPAMWSIFQVQELLGMSPELRWQNPDDERINVPANPKHYWRYRMHLTVEQLLKEGAFNEEIRNLVTASGRA
jgi:4-alpha-glucanotransferase